MWGWRARIGFVIPGDLLYAPEFYSILPDGVAMDFHSLGIERLIHDEIERTFNMYLPAAKHLATQECDVIVVAGSPIMNYMGYDRALELKRKVTEETGIPAILHLEACFDALKFLSAKRIVIATPYEPARNEERKRLAESLGFEVLNIKGLGFERRVEFGKQPPYASYRLARQAFLEAPEAEAIFISCPEWPTVSNIQKLESETGRPVVTSTAAIIWAALRTVNIKDSIKGYGRLLE